MITITTIEKPMGDGSSVFDLRLTDIDTDNSIDINCVDERAAKALVWALNTHALDVRISDSVVESI
jgi:hypothetical protein